MALPKPSSFGYGLREASCQLAAAEHGRLTEITGLAEAVLEAGVMVSQWAVPPKRGGFGHRAVSAAGRATMFSRLWSIGWGRESPQGERAGVGQKVSAEQVGENGKLGHNIIVWTRLALPRELRPRLSRA